MGELDTPRGITKAEKADIAKLAEASHEYAERFGVAAPPFHLPPPILGRAKPATSSPRFWLLIGAPSGHLNMIARPRPCSRTTAASGEATCRTAGMLPANPGARRPTPHGSPRPSALAPWPPYRASGCP